MDSSRADSVARVRQDSINRAQPGYVVDSILPVEEQLRRFRENMTEPLNAFVGGGTTADELVRSFVRAVESADTVALVRITISRAEFAWLIYPDSPLSSRPYQQAPDLVWMQHAASSVTGLARVLERLGGRSIGYRGWSCDRQPFLEGRNRIWRGCIVQFDQAPDAKSLQLFASIVERSGRYKILSYANGY